MSGDKTRLIRLILKRYPTAVAVEYSCVDDPADVVLWNVRNASGRLLFNWRTAGEHSWPELGETVDALAQVVRRRRARGNGLIYLLS